jgi:hypothetical protein
MQTMEMRKRGLRKKKIVEAIVRKCVEKATLILLTHVSQPTLENGGAWVVWNQDFVNVTIQVTCPFALYACCTCEWVL